MFYNRLLTMNKNSMLLNMNRNSVPIQLYSGHENMITFLMTPNASNINTNLHSLVHSFVFQPAYSSLGSPSDQSLSVNS